MEIRVARLSPHFIWLMGLLEAVTVPLVLILPRLTGLLANPVLGVVVGFAGAVVVLYCLNLVIRLLKIPVGGRRMVRLSVLSSAIWSGLTLAFLFILQEIFGGFIPLDYPYYDMAIGFISTAGGVLCFGLLYHVVVRPVPLLAVKIGTAGGGLLAIKGFSVFSFAAVAGLYEAVALPVIDIFFMYGNQPAIAAATGAAGGVVGGFAVWLLSVLLRGPLGLIDLAEIRPEAPGGDQGNDVS